MKRFYPLVGLLLVMVVAVVVYRPGLSGPFLFDDGPNIVHNDKLAMDEISLDAFKQAALSGHSGPLLRPLSMMSFAVNHYLTGGQDTYYFKLTNLAIHLLNGAGIFILTILLLNFYRTRFESELSGRYIPWISLAISAAWLLHPFNLTSVLYIVQRMTSLSALFMIWGMVFYLWGRTKLHEGGNGIWQILVSLLIFTPLAALSKENGLLLPLLILLAEWILFGFRVSRPELRRILIGTYVLLIGLPVVIALSYFAMHAEVVLAGYAIRDFTMIERLLTEARVLWFYIGQIVLPGTAQMGLYHDDIAISRDLLTPISTPFALVGVVGLLLMALMVRKRAPMISFGVLFFLVGHLLESTIIPLEIAHEHRNYLPMYGLLLAVFFYVLHPLKQVNYLRLRQVFVVLLIALLAFNTFARAGKWSNPYDLFYAEVDHHPNSALAHGELGAVLSGMLFSDPISIEKKYIAAREHFEKAAMLDKKDAKPLFALIMMNAGMGKPIEPIWLQELAHRLEHSPYAAIYSDKLTALMKCQLEGYCRLANIEFENLLEAALRNQTMAGLDRAKVLYALSSYIINVKQDYPAALDVMREMVWAAPEHTAYRFALIEFMMALGRIEEAKEELDIVKNTDSWNLHREKIDTLEQGLANMTPATR